jgi:hypothetical protein
VKNSVHFIAVSGYSSVSLPLKKHYINIVKMGGGVFFLAQEYIQVKPNEVYLYL